MKQKLFLVAISICMATMSQAQKYMGVATGNWSGMLGVDLNPANVVDNRIKFELDMFGLNLGVDNNLAGINTDKISDFINNGGKIKDILNFSGDKQVSLILPYAELRLPGFMVNINHKNSISFSMKFRTMNQIENFDQSFFRTILDDSIANRTNYDITSKNFNWTINSWREFNFTYGRILYEKDEHMLKAGITVKYLAGYRYNSIKGNNMDVHFTGAKDSLNMNNTDIQFSSNIADSTSDFSNLSKNFASSLTNLSYGNGWGANIGIVYEYRPRIDDYTDVKTKELDPGSNKYKLKVALSVMDIGSINYNNTYNVSITGNGNITGNDALKNFMNYGSVRKYAESRGFKVDTTVGTTKVYMPTMFIGSVDYKVWKPFYLNVTYMANMANRSNYGNSFYNQTTLTPRLDYKVVSLAMPFTMSTLTGGTKLGMAIRLGGFYIGLDDMLILMNNNQKGLNFYTGLYVPISKKKAKHGESEKDVIESKNDKVIQ